MQTFLQAQIQSSSVQLLQFYWVAAAHSSDAQCSRNHFSISLLSQPVISALHQEHLCFLSTFVLLQSEMGTGANDPTPGGFNRF